MPVYDLYSAWFRVADWCAYDLAKDGYEALVLQPFGAFPKAAATIVHSAFRSQDYHHRKIAACLAGWITVPQTSLLEDLLQSEAARDARLDPNDLQRLETQSVVEDIVFAATRWARSERLRSAALALLSSIVQRTVAGEYWNTASYALVTLRRYAAEGADELLRQFQAFANGVPPEHPSKPSLNQERQFARNLAAGHPGTLSAIESVLDEKDAVMQTTLDENSQATIDQLCVAAREFEGEKHTA